MFGEYLKGENGPYTQQTMQWIRQDLDANPLLPGQKIVLVGHSGGGAVAANLASMLEHENRDVQAVVTMGSPVANYDQAAEYAAIHEIRDQHDMIGLPIIRSSESTSILASINPLVSLAGNELLMRDSNPNAAHTTTHAVDKSKGAVEAHSSYHANPVVSHILGQYSSGHHQPPSTAGASASGASR